MTKMQDISKSGFRELKPEEVEAVSGGTDEGADIVVEGVRPPPPDFTGWYTDYLRLRIH